jgi:hypothetical protein
MGDGVGDRVTTVARTVRLVDCLAARAAARRSTGHPLRTHGNPVLRGGHPHVCVVVSVAAFAATVVFGCLAALRAQYDRVLNVIDFISSVQVTQARHRIGLIIHRGVVSEREVQDRIADLFVILWAYERVEAVRRTLPRSGLMIAGPLGGPHRLLRESIGPGVDYWRTHIGRVERVLNSPDTAMSARPLYALAAAWRR